MVNQVILNYFKEHRAAHSLEDLKVKVLGAGYSREDVEEALVALREGVDKTAAPGIRAKCVREVKKSRIKWMKVAGILGFVFLGLMIVSTAYSFRICSSPITWPPNLLDGPHTLARFIFFDIPFSIFSAASLKVEFFFIIIGSLLGAFFGSLV